MIDSNESATWEDVIRRQIYQSAADSLFPTQRQSRQQPSNKFWSSQLSKLESFVHEAVKGSEIPFVPKVAAHQFTEADSSALANKYFSLMPDFLQVVHLLSKEFDYNELIETFIAGCDAMGLTQTPVYWGNRLGRPDPLQPIPALQGLTAGVVFNNLVSHMRATWRTGASARYWDRCRDVDELVIDYCNYADALFEDCARQLIIRVDFTYVKSFGESVDPQTAIDDLNHLVKNMAHNKMFRALNGYIAKLEYGIEKGLHWHVLFFFDGSQRDAKTRVFLAEKIGKYWSTTVTKGRGDYWNCHTEEQHYFRLGILGIGEINADQRGLRENLRKHVIAYLCKEEQYLRPKGSRGIRLIRRGLFPKLKPIKPGRPRTRVPNTNPMDVRRKKTVRLASSSTAEAPSKMSTRQHV